MLKESVISPSIRSGELCHQVKLAGKSVTQDSFGQPLNTWTPYLTTRASIAQLSGQELFQGDEFTSASQIRIAIRWPGAGVVNVGDRIFFQTHVYVIQIVENVFMKNRVIKLTCLEIDGSS